MSYTLNTEPLDARGAAASAVQIAAYTKLPLTDSESLLTFHRIHIFNLI